MNAMTEIMLQKNTLPKWVCIDSICKTMIIVNLLIAGSDLFKAFANSDDRLFARYSWYQAIANASLHLPWLDVPCDMKITLYR